MVYKEPDINPTTRVFFSFFITKLVKGSWVTLRNRQTCGLFTPYFNNYKHRKDKFSCVRGQEDSLGVLEASDISHFMLSCTEDPVILIDYDQVFLSFE